MYIFKCTRCGEHGEAAKYDDVPGNKHATVDACLKALHERINSLRVEISRYKYPDTTGS